MGRSFIGWETTKNPFRKMQNFVKTLLKKRASSILFSDEKIFTIEEKFNRQNDRVYTRSCYEAKEKLPRVQRGHHPPSAMVW